MMYIFAVIGGVWALCFVLRLLFGGSEQPPSVIVVTHRVDDETKDKRNLGGGLGL